MAHIHRLIAALALLLVCLDVSAAFAPTFKYFAYIRGNIYGTYRFDSVAEACEKVRADMTVSYGTLGSYRTLSCSVGTDTAVMKAIPADGTDNPNLYYFSVYADTGQPASCPTGSTLANGQCTCTAPAVQNSTNNGCAIPNPETLKCDDIAALNNVAMFGRKENVLSGNVPSGPVCGAFSGMAAGRGCQSDFERTAFVVNADKTVTSYGWVVPRGGAAGGAAGCAMASTAPTTSTTPPVSPTASPTACVGSAGQVNGVTVCIPFSQGTATVQTKKTTTVATPATAAASAATSSTENVTTCTNNSCNTVSTSTTVTPGQPTTTSTSSVGQTRDDYCKANSDPKQCGNGESSAFSGACTAGFTCDGDAVQCAIAKEVHEQNCKMNKENPMSALFNSESVKTGNRTEDLPGNSTINIGPSSFSTANALGVGPSCITDLPVTVMGRSLLLPFSKVCPSLEYLGMLLLGISFILAARIVTRG